MFDTLTDDERRELANKMHSSTMQFSRVTLTLGDICLKTYGSLTPEGISAWNMRTRFQGAGHEAFDIAMELLAT